MKNKILNIARGVRQELEEIGPWMQVPAGGRPNPHFPKHLGGYCGYGATMLYAALTAAGLEAEVISGSGHWFAKCGEYLVDVTASQFGQAKVVVRDFERVQEMIQSGEYQMNWWNRVSSGSPCEMNLCNNHKIIAQARERLIENQTDADNCNTCGEG